MKRFLTSGSTLFCLFIIALVAIGANVKPWDDSLKKLIAKQEEANRERWKDGALEKARIVGDHINYIKDSRTGFCFALYWGGNVQGGPAMATVECTVAVEKEIKVGLWYRTEDY